MEVLHVLFALDGSQPDAPTADPVEVCSDRVLDDYPEFLDVRAEELAAELDYRRFRVVSFPLGRTVQQELSVEALFPDESPELPPLERATIAPELRI